MVLAGEQAVQAAGAIQDQNQRTDGCEGREAWSTDRGHSYYLYDDATNPQASPANWSRYEAILAKVMKLEVAPAESGNLPRVRHRYVEHPVSPD